MPAACQKRCSACAHEVYSPRAVSNESRSVKRVPSGPGFRPASSSSCFARSALYGYSLSKSTFGLYDQPRRVSNALLPTCPEPRNTFFRMNWRSIAVSRAWRTFGLSSGFFFVLRMMMSVLG